MRDSLLPVFFAMAAVTYLPRAVPMLLLSRLNLPKWLIKWLSFVPVAVLSALLLPDLLTRRNGGTRVLWVALDNLYLMASVPTFVVAARTKNMFASIIAGLASIFTLSWLFSVVR